jgi:hypothetical protein
MGIYRFSVRSIICVDLSRPSYRIYQVSWLTNNNSTVSLLTSCATMKFSFLAFWLLLAETCRAASFVPFHRPLMQPNTYRSLAKSIPDEPTTQAAFVNNGPFAPLAPILELGGITPGKAITNGVFAVPVDESKKVSEEVATKLRVQASQDLVNIGAEERTRRDVLGTYIGLLAGAYLVWASLFADDGGISGHLLRLLAILPVFIAGGYKASARTGLCNVAQAGLWDVDGNGLQKIENQSVAQAILTKVNNFNVKTAVTFGLPVVAFALLPQSTSQPLVLAAILFFALYKLEGKIPQE